MSHVRSWKWCQHVGVTAYSGIIRNDVNSFKYGGIIYE